jgi:hypothetical protein
MAALCTKGAPTFLAGMGSESVIWFGAATGRPIIAGPVPELNTLSQRSCPSGPVVAVSRRCPVAVLNWMGINIVECLDLEELVATARRLNRYEFAITFAPLPVEGGTGSPVNPLAIFQRSFRSRGIVVAGLVPATPIGRAGASNQRRRPRLHEQGCPTWTVRRIWSERRLETHEEHDMLEPRGQGASRPRKGSLPPVRPRWRSMIILFPPVLWTPGIAKEFHDVRRIL